MEMRAGDIAGYIKTPDVPNSVRQVLHRSIIIATADQRSDPKIMSNMITTLDSLHNRIPNNLIQPTEKLL